MGWKGHSIVLSVAHLSILSFIVDFGSIAFPQSPGNEDTYMYVNCGQPIYSSPGPDTIWFDLRYDIKGTGTSKIVGFTVPLQITSSSNCLVAVVTDTGLVFPASSGVKGFPTKSVDVRGSGPDSFHVVYAALTISGAGVTGDGLFARIGVLVNSTCTIYMDTLFEPPATDYLMSDEQARRVNPGWGGPKSQGGYPPSGRDCVVATCTQPTYAVGTGRSVLNDTVNHLDVWFDCNNYFLHDVTRKQNTNPHGHNGRMQSGAYISTVRYGAGEFSDNDNTWDDSIQATGVDAHVYAGLTYDFMQNTVTGLGWNGVDNTGKSMVSIVGDPSDTNSAHFDYSSDRVVYLNPTAIRYSLSGCLDVVAHEWAHGIIKYTSKLRGSREAGALGESFSDMFGVTVEWVKGSQNWVIAETSYIISPYYLRNLQTPWLKSQADTWGEGWWQDPSPDSCPNPDTTNDSCWVTKNMGIPNKMFYLLANGGSHNDVTVTGIGIENAMKIMFRADTLYWDSTTTFVRAAVGSILAAFDLNYVSSWPQQTSRAWTAVKVCDTLPGDANALNSITLGDAIGILNYVFERPGGPWITPPLCRGEVDGVSPNNIIDVIWLVNYIFDKPRDNPYCLGPNPINCWLPIPSDVCCKLP